MSQVSKRQLTKKIEEKVFDSFWAVIADLKKKNDVSLFFTDFFTKAERINFAKRMSIAVFLSKGYDYRSIRDMLKVSINTIGRIAPKVENPGWKLFSSRLEKIEEWREFWHDAELLLWRFTGGGRRAFKTNDELEAINRKRNRLSH